MHHQTTAKQTKDVLSTIVERLRSARKPMMLPTLAQWLALVGYDAENIVLVLNAVAQFTDLNDETGELTIQGPYERHDDETLARMVWQQLLAGACAQHPAHS